MSLNKLRILIADDHPLFRLGLRQVIESEPGITVYQAADGQEALRLIREQRPDVDILDINMPQLDGVNLVRHLRQEQLPGEIIFLTMYKEEELFNSAMDLGVKGYVLKESAVSEII